MVGTVKKEEDGLELWDKGKEKYFLSPFYPPFTLFFFTPVSGEFNIGLLYFRPTQPALTFSSMWAHELLVNSSHWDQLLFNQLLISTIGPTAENGLVFTLDRSLRLGILPVSLFCSGHTFFVQRLPSKLHLQPYSLHTTFQFSGTAGKRHRLRESLEFRDPPEYYHSSSGFVAMEAHIPPSVLFPPAFNISTHFALVNFQLKSLKALLALATILNRTAVSGTRLF